MSLDYTRPIRVKGTHEKVEILRTDLPGNWPILALITCQDGSQYATTWARAFDDWENIPVPKRSGTVWVNVYEDGACVAHLNRESADKHGTPDRVACVEVHWTEGEGL